MDKRTPWRWLVKHLTFVAWWETVWQWIFYVEGMWVEEVFTHVRGTCAIWTGEGMTPIWGSLHKSLLQHCLLHLFTATYVSPPELWQWPLVQYSFRRVASERQKRCPFLFCGAATIIRKQFSIQMKVWLSTFSNILETSKAWMPSYYFFQGQYHNKYIFACSG